MIRAVLLVLFSLFLIGCAGSAVLVHGPSGPKCGGVVVGDGRVLTAAHCLPVTSAQGYFRSPTPARPVLVDEASDRAWLASEVVAPAAWRTRRPVPGEVVYAVVPGDGWSHVDGAVTRRVFQTAGLPGYWETDISANPGWSGSPIFGADGALLGVVVGCLGTVQAAGDHVEKTCKAGWTVFVEAGP